MAMLAEPRRKQKWSVDPRNSAWSKDESKFGQKMLEKMGWSKGKGLGAKEQGSTDHVKVQLKNNTLGLGAAVNHEDNWLAHQDDFNQILAQLNNCHGQNEAESPSDEQKKTFSLEEKSKTSKKRVHYMKFAKGKDLSSRSDIDLACIFGKRQKNKKQTEEEASAESQGEDDTQQSSQCSNTDPDVPGNTVTSTLSVSEYFAKRMAKLKKFQNKEEIKEGGEPAGDEAVGEAGTQSSDEPSVKSKKKKKRKRNAEEDSAFSEETVVKRFKNKEPECVENLEEPDQEGQVNRKKKKRKDKRRDRDTCIDGGFEGLVTAAMSPKKEECEAPATGKKRNKKKKSKKTRTKKVEGN